MTSKALLILLRSTAPRAKLKVGCCIDLLGDELQWPSQHLPYVSCKPCTHEAMAPGDLRVTKRMQNIPYCLRKKQAKEEGGGK